MGGSGNDFETKAIKDIQAAKRALLESNKQVIVDACCIIHYITRSIFMAVKYNKICRKLSHFSSLF
jgi:hypothetical protein